MQPEANAAQTVLDWILAHWGFCTFVLGIVVQITPAIKWNPLTWVGNLFLGTLRKELADVHKEIDENEKDRIRWEVLDFANSCRNNIRHTKDEFQHIITLNTKYKKLLEKSDDQNGVFDAEYDYVLEL